MGRTHTGRQRYVRSVKSDKLSSNLPGMGIACSNPYRLLSKVSSKELRSDSDILKLGRIVSSETLVDRKPRKRFRNKRRREQKQQQQQQPPCSPQLSLQRLFLSDSLTSLQLQRHLSGESLTSHQQLQRQLSGESLTSHQQLQRQLSGVSLTSQQPPRQLSGESLTSQQLERPMLLGLSCEDTTHLLAWCASLLPSVLQQASSSVSELLKVLLGADDDDDDDDDTSPIENSTDEQSNSDHSSPTEVTIAKTDDVSDCEDGHAALLLQKDCRQRKRAKRSSPAGQHVTRDGYKLVTRSRPAKKAKRGGETKKEWRTSAAVPV